MAHVATGGRDQPTVLQPNGLFLTLARPVDAAKLLPAKPQRDNPQPASPMRLPPPAPAPEPLLAGSSPAPSPPAPQRAGTTPAAWPRGPPLA